MKLTMSPVFAGASGRAADVVIANWKGIIYGRKFVTPANPQTAAQIAQRNKNTYKVWFAQHWDAKWKQAWTEFVAGRPLSAQNGFSTFNKLDPFGADGVLATPFNTDVLTPADMAAIAGGSTKEIDYTWTDPAISGSYIITITILGLSNPGTKMDRDDWPSPDDIDVAATLATAATYTATMGQAATGYHCYAALWDPTVDLSKACGIKGVSKNYHILTPSQT